MRRVTGFYCTIVEFVQLIARERESEYVFIVKENINRKKSKTVFILSGDIFCAAPGTAFLV